MKYWEIIADDLSKAGWSWAGVATVDHKGREIWVVAAERGTPMKSSERLWNLNARLVRAVRRKSRRIASPYNSLVTLTFRSAHDDSPVITNEENAVAVMGYYARRPRNLDIRGSVPATAALGTQRSRHS
jgi:hypothetical protein